ncbi:MAG: leucyl aminopeptidase [Candidatus Curtissbacteria bacterium]|nr:leucyl aminopeptidase [Candidatus Curtissbacteria bacterium]MDZ4210043.1 leucyl aminopeptidase [Candidatus Curtissbacteria bacterium]
MRVNVLKGVKLSDLKCEVLVVGVLPGTKFASDKAIREVDELTDGAMLRYLSKNEKFGKTLEVVPFHISPKKHKFVEKVILLGMGSFDNLDNYKLRQVAAYAGKNKGKDTKSVAFSLPAAVSVADKIELLVIGFLDGNFDSGHHKTKQGHHLEFEELVILSDKASGDIQKRVDRALIIADSIHKVREVVNQPANIATPEYLVSFAKKIAASEQLKIQVFSEKQVNEMGMGIMASVAKGSDQDLYFVVMRYLGAGSAGPTLALVGKGITFDSGGISIKPGEQMDWMKMDMAGAASCFGAMEAISKLKPKVNVIVACPLTENLPSGKASKPGDVVKGLSGKTVEIINTDAEGRLVLSDALTYVQKNFKPDYIVDVATLTGAVVVALGNLATGAMGRPQEFIEEVIKAGEATGERIWQLPLYDEYKELIKSYIADIANLSSGKGAGAQTAAKFLEDFVDRGQKWVHLDIASTAWEESDKPYCAKGATGSSVTTLVELAMNLERGI